MPIVKIKDEQDQDKEVDMKHVLGTHADEGLEYLRKAAEPGADQMDRAIAYTNWLKETTGKLAGMSPEELNGLPAVERQKLIRHVQEKVETALDFMKPSANAGS